MENPYQNIDKFILENNIPEAINNFDCPFCKTQHSSPIEIMYGSEIYRSMDSGFDFKQVLICDDSQKMYWYLNGV